ncbi:MAG: hypothetical protein QF722_01770 [Candidatus Thalassarchaeaceae archaeon]|jgi:hypothetical protein|nr:hypothetical protein [Candidatus Thalassarchaeaceae archaeon]MDP6844259.1 hypothetical protein [Candidatus Thalassarchaeaceae archaeon]
MSKKRVLGRGLDDLLAQHDQDLPFLDAYGPSIGESEGLPSGVGIDPAEQLMEAIARLLQAEGHQNTELMTSEVKENGVHITVLSGGDKLPLVPSDLGAPGFEEGKLAADRSEASVTIVQWGIPARRLLERLCEHWSG